MLQQDTITALVTAVGESSVGIIRISGPGATSIANKIYKGKTDFTTADSHTVHYGYVYDRKQDKKIDEAIFLLMRGPRSFTGEDVVEVQCHGGMVVLKQVLQLILSCGARLAEQGEFSKRAFLNGRLDLAQAESIMDIVQAKTERGVDLALSQLQGSLSGMVKELRADLLELVAFIQADIDYPDDDSCSEVSGDFELRYFNIERDKRNIIPLARAAQKYCPELQLFMSPWSPPAWMKINQDYPVLSRNTNQQDPRKDYVLFMDDGKAVDPDEMKLLGERNGVFPRRLAMQDYFIQDPRYLQCYADMFCKFIDLYAEQGLPITKVMYQNEAYSYTPYPGCAWTAEGTLRFNNEYLAPTLAEKHPEVELWIGTFNTNRLDYVQKILDDPTLQKNVKGVGTQWECRYNLPEMRKRYPNLRFMQSESECGNGNMDWKAGEHTFMLLSDNLGNGCDEYYNWNFILTDNGASTWGWTQNALIQVDSKTRRMRYTAEYFAYKHFCHFVTYGTQIVGYGGRDNDGAPVVVFKRNGEYIVTAGNFTDEEKTISVKIGDKFLNMQLPAHSFNTFVEK